MTSISAAPSKSSEQTKDQHFHAPAGAIVHGRTIPTTEAPPAPAPEKIDEILARLDSCWAAYSKDSYGTRANRMKFGGVLDELQTELATPGKEGRFRGYLKKRGIPHSTAYEVLADYNRLKNAPQVLIQAAEKSCLDLTAKRYAKAVAERLAGNQQMTANDAAEFIHFLQEIKPEPKYGPGLTKEDKELHRVFEALKTFTANVPDARKNGYAQKALNHWAYYDARQEDSFELKIEPQPVEDDWLLSPSKGKKGVAA